MEAIKKEKPRTKFYSKIDSRIFMNKLQFSKQTNPNIFKLNLTPPANDQFFFFYVKRLERFQQQFKNQLAFRSSLQLISNCMIMHQLSVTRSVLKKYQTYCLVTSVHSTRKNYLLAEYLLLHQLAIHLLFLKTVQESLSHCHHQGFFEDVQPRNKTKV